MSQHLVNTLLVLGGMILGALIAYLANWSRRERDIAQRVKDAQDLGYSIGISDGLLQGFKNSADGHTKNGYMAASKDLHDGLEQLRGRFTVVGLLDHMQVRRNERRATGVWGDMEARKPKSHAN